MTEQTHEKLKAIKQSFRLMMVFQTIKTKLT